jgi:hypothetical protein
LGAFHEHVVLVVLLATAAPVVVLVAAGADTLPGWIELLLVALALGMVSGLGRHLVAAPLARALKRLSTRSFRVLYFRSFAPEASHAARDSLSSDPRQHGHSDHGARPRVHPGALPHRGALGA